MAKQLDFYLDLISPFTYLAHLKLPDLAERYGYSINYHPIDLPTAKKAAGNYGPSNREVPAKIKALGQDLARWAALYGVPMNFPKGFDAWKMNVGVFYAAERGQERAYVDEAFNMVWGDAVDPADEAALRELATRLGWDGQEFLDYVNSDAGERAFEACRLKAHERGVFGAPIVMIDDQIWWGNDRLHFIEEYMQQAA